MAIPQVLRFIQQIWRKPSSDHLFSARHKKLYRSFSLATILGVVALCLTVHFVYPDTADKWRLRATAALSPLLAPLHSASLFFSKSLPDYFYRLQSAWNESGQLEQLHQELERLKYNNQHLQAENAYLRQVLNLPFSSTGHSITAEVFALTFDGFENTLLLKTPDQQPLEKNMCVVDGFGLVGRVIATDSYFARVMTIADPNLRVPVLVGKENLHAIVAGDGPNTMRFLYFDKAADLQVGDHVVTSGQGGVYQPGIPVGVVTQISPIVRLKTAATLKHLRFVKVISPHPSISYDENAE